MVRGWSAPQLTAIHLKWSGPYTYEEIRKMRADEDRGVYQIYGWHPIYGRDALLYIGMTGAGEENFAARFAGRKDIMTSPWSDNQKLYSAYVGRIHRKSYASVPSRDKWVRLIEIAEALLIRAHCPSWNNRFEMTEEVIKDYHVFNWSQFKHLLPEVSGNRWSNTCFFSGIREEPPGGSKGRE